MLKLIFLSMIKYSYISFCFLKSAITFRNFEAQHHLIINERLKTARDLKSVSNLIASEIKSPVPMMAMIMMMMMTATMAMMMMMIMTMKTCLLRDVAATAHL